jgi:predicted nucleic acid binding AN1-type Zn finger protein
MKKLHILVFDYGDGLVNMTTKSIQDNMPDWTYSVLPVCVRNKTLFYAYNYSKKHKTPVLAVDGGIILKIKEEDIPDRFDEYPMVVSRKAVHSRKNNYLNQYSVLGHNIVGQIDLSIFMLNWKKFDFHPKKNQGVLSKINSGYMPRSMNHRSDPLFVEACNPYTCLNYGVYGMNASVLNYTKEIKKSKLEMNETFAYPFELLTPYVNLITNNEYRKNLISHIKRSKKNAGKLRRRFSQVSPCKFNVTW